MEKFQTIEKNCISHQHQIWDYLKKGLNEEAKLVLQKVENIGDLTDTTGFTLLHHSVRFENAEMTQYLIDKGCHVNAQDSFGYTPLMQAIGADDEMTAEILLKNDADIYLTDYDGMSSLEKAARSWFRMPVYKGSKSHLIIEMFFITVNDDFSKGKLTEFLLSANDMLKLAVVVFGNVEITKFILKNCPSIVDFHEPVLKYTALHWAFAAGRLENWKILMEHGATMEALDRMGLRPMFYYAGYSANEDENFEVLKSFLSSPISLSARDLPGHTDLQTLLLESNEKTVRAVLQSGIHTEPCFDEDDSFLFELTNNRIIDNLDFLTELNIEFDVNTTDEDGIRPLMPAVFNGMTKKVEFLLKHGADVNWTSCSSGYSALSYVNAISSDPVKERDAAAIVELLLQYGLDAQSFFSNMFDFYDKYRKSRADSFTLSTKVIVAHFAMLNALETSLLIESPRNTIESTPRLKSYFDLCTQQLEEMKAFEVYGTVTLFELLTENEEKIVGYARNRELFAKWSSALESLTHFEAYYSKTLRRRLSHASDEAELRKKVALAIDALTGLCSDVYHSIVYKIMKYLDRQDLYNLCAVDNIFQLDVIKHL